VVVVERAEGAVEAAAAHGGGDALGPVRAARQQGAGGGGDGVVGVAVGSVAEAADAQGDAEAFEFVA
jgi:hypothetical protein